MRKWWVLSWSALMLVGAAFVRTITNNVSFMGLLASYEAVHIVAHTFLYGSLAALGRWAGLRPLHAASLALTVGVLQESVQLLTAYHRGPGLPELFDLGVDSVAIALALALFHLLSKAGTHESRRAET